MTKSYQVKVDGFEGPLDLLLHLINRYEIDIYDIPVSQITDQYMHYIHTMKELELDLASEYLVMAATLLAIKSQMLLPNPNVDDPDEVEMEDDPREELMRKLIEYRKYKQAAEQLKEKELDANRIYTRPPMSKDELGGDDAPELKPGEASIYDMIQAMGKLLNRSKTTTPQDTKIKRDEIPIQMRMDEILHQVDLKKEGTPFYELFEKRTRPHIVVTFMALLELMKSNDITCVQQKHFDELIVFKMEDAPWS
ncbi:segregation/condensation protein A [Halobacillus sp. BBL2006]|uniref:segregation/condensation protein A n=1 Tax=Halobacillus sp. BBL2006 TaxID=1543706 RepID=UPI0005427E35|nr:segregation/condensation protein A [Halobacillus sp. BBL2006]KHE72611.1 segregation and condensation protein A [Halobacillus sp. BBL2006]